jgi:uncharacterized protein (DUF983 family)
MSSTTDCPNCHEGDLITITMEVADRELAFRTCHRCEARWWFRDGDMVPMAFAVELARR